MGFFNGNHSNVLAVRADQTDFRHPDGFIYTVIDCADK